MVGRSFGISLHLFYSDTIKRTTGIDDRITVPEHIFVGLSYHESFCIGCEEPFCNLESNQLQLTAKTMQTPTKSTL